MSLEGYRLSADSPRRSFSLEEVVSVFYLLLAGLFLVTSLYVITVASWTVISFDQWRIYDDYFSQGWPWGLLAPQNGHRPIVPGLLFLADIRYFGAHNYLVNFIGITLALSLACLWSWQILRDHELPPFQQRLSIGLVWMLIFWLANRRVLGHGNESLHVYLLLNGLFLGWWAIARCDRQSSTDELRGVLLSCLGCSLATFSFGAGIIAWPIVIGLALYYGFSKTAITFLGFVSALHLALYATGLSSTTEESLLEGLVVADTLIDSATWLGSPVFHILTGLPHITDHVILEILCPALGLLGFVITLGVTVRLVKAGREPSMLESWSVTLMIFGLGSSFLIALARQSYFNDLPEQRVAPRYLPWVCIFWAAVLVILAINSIRLRRSRRLAVGTWTAVALLLPISLVPRHTGDSLEYAKYRLEQAAISLSLGLRHDPTVQWLFRTPQVVYRVADHLEDRNVAMFSWPVADQLKRPFEHSYRIVDFTTKAVRPTLNHFTTDNHGSSSAFFWGTLTAPPSNYSDLVVVDHAGIIQGGGLIRATRHGWARRIGLLARMPPRYFGFVKNIVAGEHYRVFAVDLNDSTAILLTEIVTDPISSGAAPEYSKSSTAPRRAARKPTT